MELEKSLGLKDQVQHKSSSCNFEGTQQNKVDKENDKYYSNVKKFVRFADLLFRKDVAQPKSKNSNVSSTEGLELEKRTELKLMKLTICIC